MFDSGEVVELYGTEGTGEFTAHRSFLLSLVNERDIVKPIIVSSKCRIKSDAQAAISPPTVYPLLY